jgi:hypothetical protein
LKIRICFLFSLSWTAILFYSSCYCWDDRCVPPCPAVFCWDAVLWTFYLGWPGIKNLPISVFQVTRMTGVSHQCPNSSLLSIMQSCFC